MRRRGRESTWRWVRLPLAVLLALLAALAAARIVAAPQLVVGSGEPIATGRSADVPLERQPVEGSARLGGLDVPDPDGGPPWDVRIARTRTGAICATPGQVRDGEFGIVGLDRRFRALPPAIADACGIAQPHGATLAAARPLAGGTRLSDLTVVNGVAAPPVKRAVVYAGGRAVQLRLGARGAFLAVFRGVPEILRPRIVLTEASGRTSTVRFTDAGEFVAPDPSGGSLWTIVHSTGAPGVRCVKPVRVAGPHPSATKRRTAPAFATPPSIPRRCARRGVAFAAVRRLVPSPDRMDRTLWGLNPAATIVWGSAQRAMAEVVLTGAGRPRELPTDGPAGGFLAVLDGRVDPREVRVTVDGRPLDQDRTLDPAGRPSSREPVPAWRDVAAVARTRARLEALPRPRGMTIDARAEDPAGAQSWALRSWTSRAHRGPVLGGGVVRLRCWVVGARRDGGLAEPLPGGRWRTVRPGDHDMRCLPQRGSVALEARFDTAVHLDDADLPDPTPVRVLVHGMLGAGVRSAQLLGAGAPRALALGRDGLFLAVLGPEHAGARLRVRVRDARGARTSRTPLGTACKPRAGVSIQVADPHGGPPWTAGRGRLGRRGCTYLGRRIDGRVGVLADGRNVARFDHAGWGVPRRARPVTFDMVSWSPEPGARRSRAEIERRALPGRAVIDGITTADVAAITLRTARDVRTVRPGPGGLLLVVYDGVPEGPMETVAQLLDGSTVTQRYFERGI